MSQEKWGFNQDTYSHLNLKDTHLVYLELFYLVLVFLLSVKIHKYFLLYNISKRKVFITFMKQCIFSAKKKKKKHPFSGVSTQKIHLVRKIFLYRWAEPKLHIWVTFTPLKPMFLFNVVMVATQRKVLVTDRTLLLRSLKQRQKHFLWRQKTWVLTLLFPHEKQDKIHWICK